MKIIPWALAALIALTGCQTESPVLLFTGESKDVTAYTGTVRCTAPPAPEDPKPDPLPDPLPDIIMLHGETVGIELPGPGCPTLTNLPPNMKAEVLEFREVETLQPSYLGARVGKYRDALVPCVTGEHGVWVDFTVAALAPPHPALAVNLLGKSILILPASVQARPLMPFYAAFQPDAFTDPSANVRDRAGPVREAIDRLRAHRIEPIHQWWNDYAPQNPDLYKDLNAHFDRMVIEGAIAPPMLVRYKHRVAGQPDDRPSDAALVAYEAAIQSGRWPQDSWAYVVDEGQDLASRKIVLQERSALYRRLAPSMDLWATWEEVPGTELLDGVWPVLDWFRAPERVQTYSKPYGLYTSCMAQGSCENGKIGTPTGTPLSVIEAPAMHLRMFPIVAYALGARRAMYFSLTKKTRAAFIPGGQYDEGGNGDGTATYLHNGRLEFSVRVKHWRAGMFDLEYLRLLGEDGSALVRSPRDWEKDPAKLQDLRIRLAKKMGAL